MESYEANKLQQINDKGYNDITVINTSSSSYKEHLDAMFESALVEILHWLKLGIFCETADCNVEIFLNYFDIPIVTIWIKQIMNVDKFLTMRACYEKSYYVNSRSKPCIIDFKRF